MGAQYDRLVDYAVMPELKPIPQPVGLPTEIIERPPTRSELDRWQRLNKEHQRASNAIDMAGLLLSNIYTTWSFGQENDVLMPSFDPALEQQYFDVKESFEQSKHAIRLVLDHKLGIRLSGTDDLDIIEPPQSALSGLIIPVIIGIVVLAGAIGTAIWQSSIATKIANEYRRLLFDTDKMFCSDPNSALCKNWIQRKKERKYEQNLTMAERLGATLKKGVKTVAGGLATGLLVAVAVVAFLRLSK